MRSDVPRREPLTWIIRCWLMTLIGLSAAAPISCLSPLWSLAAEGSEGALPAAPAALSRRRRALSRRRGAADSAHPPAARWRRARESQSRANVGRQCRFRA